MRFMRLFFRLVKEECTLRNYNGYTLIEVIITTGIFFMAITIFVPILVQLKSEQNILSDRRHIAYDLHDALQFYIWDPSSTTEVYEKELQGKKVQFTFTKDVDSVKGCASWKNDRNANEEICFQGIPKK